MDLEEMDELSNEDIEEIIDVNTTLDIAAVNNLTSIVHPSDPASSVKEDPLAVCVFTGHCTVGGLNASVFCCCLSRNGELAATGGDQNLAFTWNTTTGGTNLTCSDHLDSIVFVEFNHNDTYLVTCDISGIIQLWQLSNNIRCWRTEISDLQWAKWHPSANVFLASDQTGQIYMWKLPQGQCKIFHGTGSPVNCGAIFPDGKFLAVGHMDGTIRVIHLKDGTVSATIPISQGHNKLVTAIDCYIKYNLIISVAIDGRTILSTAHNGKVICVLQDLSSTVVPAESCKQTQEDEDTIDEDTIDESAHNENWAETVAFCKDPLLPLAATGTVNGEIFIYDILKQVLRHKVDVNMGGLVTKILWKGDTSIFFASGSAVARCIDGKTGNCLQTFKGHNDDVLDLHISQNGERLLTVSDDTLAIVYDISSI
ncbi:angio-associated migratory cell protein isoform X2 [Harpegnathos saltator]|uniref:Angio-associated migratory cell protein n=2 Tax=Harpegnathos saltator TaxID=610380 RepID=E2BIK8_HARSA|nr:angio-associated migratory cell protein isoform X2 [Harpegnathos saltator]XP_019696999.1 angio-associated migratory cell protein isoform X2 [Harpegnathos saltator]EFN84455.1 Angio-associated migratory cell protein [Harpegnathos saltator]